MPVASPAAGPWFNVRWIVNSPIGPTGAAIEKPISSDWANSGASEESGIAALCDASSQRRQRRSAPWERALGISALARQRAPQAVFEHLQGQRLEPVFVGAEAHRLDD